MDMLGTWSFIGRLSYFGVSIIGGLTVHTYTHTYSESSE